MTRHTDIVEFAGRLLTRASIELDASTATTRVDHVGGHQSKLPWRPSPPAKRWAPARPSAATTA